MKQKSGIDRFFYCDFNQGMKLGEWRFPAGVNRVEESFRIEEKCNATLIIYANEKTLVDEYVLDGKAYPFSWGNSETAHMLHAYGLQRAFKHELEPGTHVLEITCELCPDAHENCLAEIFVTVLLPDINETNELDPGFDDKIMTYPEALQFQDCQKSHSTEGYSIGVGDGQVSLGRFGYTKGDGLLDCAMTTLGDINRLYLFGHPMYKKTTRWQYSLLPKDIDPEKKYHGSFPPAQTGYEDDDVSISYLGSSWKTVFQRPGAADVKFACQYSIASAGILIETDDRRLSLSDLQFTGNYTSVMLPLEKGLTVRSIAATDTIYDAAADGPLKENWFLIFGCSAFPDIPIQIVMTRKPEKITAGRTTGTLLSGIDIETGDEFVAGFAVSPFGIESFLPEETMNEAFYETAYERCNFWSRAVLAFPVDMDEYYKVDSDNETVKIIQKYQYRFVHDEWGTEPLKTAPLPPVLDFCSGIDGFVLDENSVDFKFPTKFGYLKGVVNSDTACYELPFIPERRRINFRPADSSEIENELTEDLRESWDFMEQFANDEFPLSPYCASYLERYRFLRSMLNYLKEPFRSDLLEKLRVNLPLALDPDRAFKLLVGVSHRELSTSEADTETVLRLFKSDRVCKKTFYNWYDRVEPITGNSYKLTYVNCGVAARQKDGSREIVEKLLEKEPMVEVDWGTGLSLSAISLSALAVGDWESVRKHWDTIRDGFKYYHLYQDWACMGAGYAENGGTWIEGANYNGFIGFCRMAEELKEYEDLNLGRYLGAKQGAYRLALFRSSQSFFPKYFRRSSWYLTKFMHDEARPAGAFQNAPDPGPDGEDFRLGGFFNLSTEGAYPEVYSLFLKHIPEEFMAAWKVYRENVEAVLDLNLWSDFAIVECHAGYLVTLALNGISPSEMGQEIAFADKIGIMLRKWFGLHYPVRRLPENCYQSYLKSIITAKEFPVWLEHWSGMEFPSAVYDADKQEATIAIKATSAEVRLECGAIAAPEQALLNGAPTSFSYDARKQRLTFPKIASGTLVLTF